MRNSYRKNEEAIAALLTQCNIEEAAKSIGIALNTLLTGMKAPQLQAAYLTSALPQVEADNLR